MPGAVRQCGGDVAVARGRGEYQGAAGGPPDQAHIIEQPCRGGEQPAWVILPLRGERGRTEVVVQFREHAFHTRPLHKRCLKRRRLGLRISSLSHGGGRRPGQIANMIRRAGGPGSRVRAGPESGSSSRSATLASSSPAVLLTAPPRPGNG